VVVPPSLTAHLHSGPSLHTEGVDRDRVCIKVAIIAPRDEPFKRDIQAFQGRSLTQSFFYDYFQWQSNLRMKSDVDREIVPRGSSRGAMMATLAHNET
jgi:hypothetical protein